jgi:ribose 5-phosphate isomerase A
VARRFGVPLTSFAEHRRIDVAIDGADQVARGTLNLVKGVGGALLREKMLAAASDRMIVVVDETKLVDRLGANTPLPVEIVLFGWQTVLDRLAAIGCGPRLRLVGDKSFTTDGGNYIVERRRRDTGSSGAGSPALGHHRRCRERPLHRPGVQDRGRSVDWRGSDREMKDANAACTCWSR